MNPQNDQPQESSLGSQFVNYKAEPTQFPPAQASAPVVPTAPQSVPIDPVQVTPPPLPQSQFVPPPPVVSNVPPQFRGPTVPLSVPPVRHSHWLAIVVLIVIILVAGGWAAYAFMLDPQAALSQSIAAADSAQKMHSSMVVTVESDIPYFSGAQLSISGDVVKHPLQLPDTSIAIDITSPNFSAAGELRSVDSVLYGKATKIPPFLATTAHISDTWYSLTLDTIRSMQGSYNVNVDPTVLAKASSLTALNEKLAASGAVTSTILDGIGREEGVFVKRYTVTIDKEALVRALLSLSNDGSLTQYKEQADALIKSMISNVDVGPVHVAARLFSGSLYSVSGDIAVQVQDKYLRIHYVLSYDDTRTDLAVTAPTGATSLDSFLKQSLIDARSKGVQARIMATVSQSRAAAEIYFDKAHSYKGVCASPVNMKALLDDIKTASGSDPVCRDSATAYMMTAKLPSIGTTTPSYYCVDSTGLTKTLSKIPTGMTCK